MRFNIFGILVVTFYVIMKTICLTCVAILSIFMISCNRYYYKPNGVNTPLFTDKGQLHLDACGSSGDGDGAGKTGFFDAQGAWSPIKHLGIIANYSSYNFTPDNFDFAAGKVAAKAHLLEGGIGGYYTVGERKIKMVMDIYGGGGAGNIKSDVNMDVMRLFLQPGIGVASPWFDASFNMRLSNVHYSNLTDNGRGIGYLEDHNLIDPLGNRIDQGSYTFMEPSLTVRTGYKFAKAQFQAVFANALSNPYWKYNGARFTVGFYFSLEGLLDVIHNGADAPKMPQRPSFPEHR